MDYLKFGELTLSVVQGVTSFVEKIGYNYATHDILEGKASLQATGEQLTEITINVALHSYLGDDIEKILATIDKICFSGEPQKLLFANGMFKGDYVLKNRDVTVVKTDGTGNIISAIITFTLLEFANRALINARNCEAQTNSNNNGRKIIEK